MCSLSEEQINTCCVCKSQGGLTANVKLHFFFASLAPSFEKNLDSKCTIYFEWPNSEFKTVTCKSIFFLSTINLDQNLSTI